MSYCRLLLSSKFETYMERLQHMSHGMLTEALISISCKIDFQRQLPLFILKSRRSKTIRLCKQAHFQRQTLYITVFSKSDFQSRCLCGPHRKKQTRGSISRSNLHGHEQYKVLGFSSPTPLARRCPHSSLYLILHPLASLLSLDISWWYPSSSRQVPSRCGLPIWWQQTMDILRQQIQNG